MFSYIGTLLPVVIVEFAALEQPANGKEIQWPTAEILLCSVVSNPSYFAAWRVCWRLDSNEPYFSHFISSSKTAVKIGASEPQENGSHL